MSLKSWCEEFYPIPACNVPEEQALDHSLTKWIGLRDKNLERHGVFFEGYAIYEKKDKIDADFAFEGRELPLQINGESCALCEQFYDTDDTRCEPCPVYQARNGVPCDEPTEYEDEHCLESPYFRMIGNTRGSGLKPTPEPMIYWLKEAKIHAEHDQCSETEEIDHAEECGK